MYPLHNQRAVFKECHDSLYQIIAFFMSKKIPPTFLCVFKTLNDSVSIKYFKAVLKCK